MKTTEKTIFKKKKVYFPSGPFRYREGSLTLRHHTEIKKYTKDERIIAVAEVPAEYTDYLETWHIDGSLFCQNPFLTDNHTLKISCDAWIGDFDIFCMNLPGGKPTEDDYIRFFCEKMYHLDSIKDEFYRLASKKAALGGNKFDGIRVTEIPHELMTEMITEQTQDNSVYVSLYRFGKQRRVSSMYLYSNGRYAVISCGSLEEGLEIMKRENPLKEPKFD